MAARRVDGTEPAMTVRPHVGGQDLESVVALVANWTTKALVRERCVLVVFVRHLMARGGVV